MHINVLTVIAIMCILYSTEEVFGKLVMLVFKRNALQSFTFLPGRYGSEPYALPVIGIA
jgi:hypothetical protein